MAMMPSADMPRAARRRIRGWWLWRLVGQNAVSAVIPSPAFRAARSGVAEYDPAQGDQAKGIPLRHLDDAVQADINVSP